MYTPTLEAQQEPCKKKLTPMEEFIIHYASEFVPRSLIKKFSLRKEDKYATFSDFLLNMSPNNCGESIDDSFLNYCQGR